jgi:hypothetical protein
MFSQRTEDGMPKSRKPTVIKVSPNFFKRAQEQSRRKRLKQPRIKTLTFPAKPGLFARLLRPSMHTQVADYLRQGWELVSNTPVEDHTGHVSHYVITFKRNF